jgi:hypothetical protein
MEKAARDAMGKTRLRAVADRGYYSGPQIKECADAGIAVMLPKPTTSSAKCNVNSSAPLSSTTHFISYPGIMTTPG